MRVRMQYRPGDHAGGTCECKVTTVPNACEWSVEKLLHLKLAADGLSGSIHSHQGLLSLLQTMHFFYL